jgi:oxalate---CoA ligase
MTFPILFNNTYSLVALHASRNPYSIALEAPGRLPLSYEGLFQNIRDTMLSLRSAGIKKQDRVAIVLSDGPEMAISLLAVSAFAVSAPLNPLYQLKEFETYLSDLKVKFLIVRAGVKSPVHIAARKNGIKVIEIQTGKQSADGRYQLLPGDIYADSFDTTSVDMMNDVFSEQSDVAIVLHTSGTTFGPKIVPLTYRNLCISVNCICKSLALSPGERCLSMMPQFHIGGFVDLLLAPLGSGGTIISTSGFNAIQFFQLLERYQPTWYQAVPANLSELLVYAERKKIAEIRSSLRLIRSVAASLEPQMMYKLESLFKVPVIQTYGMTEAAPLITTNPLPPARRKAGSVGKSIGPEVVIMNKAGNILPRGRTGEIVIRGDNIISGYENNKEVNEEAFRNGWFHTGDLGYLDDDGYLYLKGRLKEIINRGGEKISPQEVDSVLLEHPAVAQAISFPIPHRFFGEDIAAAVVLRDGENLHRKDLIEFAAKRLSFFKVPRTILFTEDIPKGPSGKVRRIGMAAKFNLGLNVSSDIVYKSPCTATQKKLADIWTKLFKLRRVGIHDNFFDLGGDDFLAIKLFLEIEKKFKHALPIYTIFRFPTIAVLSTLIEGKEKDSQKAVKRNPKS